MTANAIAAPVNLAVRLATQLTALASLGFWALHFLQRRRCRAQRAAS